MATEQRFSPEQPNTRYYVTQEVQGDYAVMDFDSKEEADAAIAQSHGRAQYAGTEYPFRTKPYAIDSKMLDAVDAQRANSETGKKEDGVLQKLRKFISGL